MRKDVKPQITHVVEVYRVSTGRQERSGLGLSAQREYCEAARKAMGWELVEGITEEAISGSVAPAERPGMKRAIELVRKMNTEALKAGKPPCAALLAAKVDRISRDLHHFTGLMKEVPLKIATMTEADDMQLHIFAMMAQKERDFIRERTRSALAALQKKADNGDEEAQQKIARRNANIFKAHAATVKVKGEPLPAPIAAATVIADKADAFAAAMKGHLFVAIHGEKCRTLQAIADYLNAQGIPTNGTRTGSDNKWTARAVRNVMNRLGMNEKGFKQIKRQKRAAA